MIWLFLESKLNHITTPNRGSNFLLHLLPSKALWQKSIFRSFKCTIFHLVLSFRLSVLSKVLPFLPISPNDPVLQPSRPFSFRTILHFSFSFITREKGSLEGLEHPSAMIIGEHSSTSSKYFEAKNLQRSLRMFRCLWMLFSNGFQVC